MACAETGKIRLPGRIGDDMRAKEMDGGKIVKCACGLVLRQKDWSDHWRSCYKGSSVPVSQADVDALLAHEQHVRERDAEHEKWVREGGPSKSRLCIRNGTLAVEPGHKGVLEGVCR